MTTGAIDLIVAERRRQEELGYTVEHDLVHNNGELLAAAMCYTACAEPVALDPAGDFTLEMWPFPLERFQPSEDPVQNMAIAAALLLAAIEREHAARAAAA